MVERRRTTLDELATKIARLLPGRVVRVAVDGRTASGKTTVSEEIAALVQNKGRPVIRTAIDGFHRPKAERYARGRYSAEGYYYDARDLAAIKALLLAPLGSGGDRRYRTASFDLDTDQPVEQEPQLAPVDAILIVDGTFLQRPELQGCWDLTIFVAASEALAEARGIKRDAARLGSEEAARQLYSQRYRPAFDLYERLCAPEQRADVVLYNDNLEAPMLQLRKGRLT